MRTILVALLFTVIAMAGGCGPGTDTSPLLEQIESLSEERSLLKQQVTGLESENQQLTGQVKTLASLDEKVRLDVLNRLDTVKIGKRSGIFDKDKDGVCETLIVYISPHDDYGDPFKAAGGIDLELWDLDADVGKARLGRWELEPTDVKKLWSTNVITNYFRLAFDVGDVVNDEQGKLTVKMKFTDYLTGRMFEEVTTVEQVK